MSLKARNSFTVLVVLAIAVAIANASCGGSPSQSTSPVGPSSLSLSDSIQAGAADQSATAGAGEATSSTAGAWVTAAVTPTPSPGTDPGPFPVVLPPPDVPRKPTYWTPTPDSNDWFNLRVDPVSPVPFSGTPVPLQSCSALPHTWYYATVLHSRTGNTFRVVERENYFDGFLVSRNTATVELTPQQNTPINSRWCSAYGLGHFTQHRYKVEGPDGRVLILNSPIIELQANPSYVPPAPLAQTAQAGRVRDNAVRVAGD